MHEFVYRTTNSKLYRVGNQDSFQITVIVTIDFKNYLLVYYHETMRFLQKDIWEFDEI
jgi:hypothetical protein